MVSAESKICTECGAKNPPSALVCVSCGASLPVDLGVLAQSTPKRVAKPVEPIVVEERPTRPGWLIPLLVALAALLAGGLIWNVVRHGPEAGSEAGGVVNPGAPIQPGDCFSDLASSYPGGARLFHSTDIRAARVNCAQTHEFEVFYVATFPRNITTSAQQDEWFENLQDICYGQAFTAYTGLNYDTSGLYVDAGMVLDLSPESVDAFIEVESPEDALAIMQNYDVTAFCVIYHEGGTTGSARIS